MIITLSTSSNNTVQTLLKQYAISTDGTPKGDVGFGLRNEFYGTNNNSDPPSNYGATEYTVVNKPQFSTIKTDYVGYNGNNFDKISEYGVNSIKHFGRYNTNYVHREYVMVGITTGIENIYLSLAGGPVFDDYIDMPDEESWNFTVRVIARNSDNVASDAFFINGYCDNTGVGTIVGQDVLVTEVGAAGLVPLLNTDIVYDINGGANNYFRVEAESNINARIHWVAYIDIVANYAIAGARLDGGNP
jgi:hypothetical protein